MTSPQNNAISSAYAAGYAQQLVVFSNDPTAQITTKYGAACGRPYPLSPGFLSDMTQLARAFAGARNGPQLYVSLFAEFQTYPCNRGGWSSGSATTNYYQALKDQFLAAEAVFHQYAPNAKVGLCWGGWQARTDDAAKGAGRSMFSHFADVLSGSDFESFQAMQSDSNVTDIQQMTHILGAYGPVLLSYYKPDNGSQATFDADVHAVFTPAYLSAVIADRLFGFAFMDDRNLAASATTDAFVRQSAAAYGRSR